MASRTINNPGEMAHPWVSLNHPGSRFLQGFLQEDLRWLHILSEEKEKEVKTFERALLYFLFLKVTFPEAAPLHVRSVKGYTKGQV